ncbi:hypothetical protein BGZ58_004086 [Dissophora ornata]|nr:hypothetical protein BGZ58_004086 [Dissophora ornata]
MALGSITYLQRYYASGGTIFEGMPYDNMFKTSFVDSLSPRSGLMPPSIEKLLHNCHEDIQSVLEVWGIISYPSPSTHATNGQEQIPDSPVSVNENDSSYTSLNTQQQHRYDFMTVDMLALLESSTKAISSIRTYSIHSLTITPEALTIHRQAALAVIEMLSILEQASRILSYENGYAHPQEYCYARLSFGDLEEERVEMKKYLAVVQEQLFKPQAQKIETQLEQLLIADTAALSRSGEVRLPKWIGDENWASEGESELSLERCHAFLEFFSPETRGPLPSPSSDIDGFLDALRACKFRLEFKVQDGSFKPIEIVKRTAPGREQNKKKATSPGLAPSIFPDF